MHQFIERRQQPGLLVDQRFVASAQRPQTRRRLDAGCDLGLSLDHRVAAHTRRSRHRGLAAPTQHLRRRARHHAPLHLIHMRQNHLEESRERLRRDLHTARILRAN